MTRDDSPETRAAFTASVVAMHDRTRDAELRSRIWDYRDGTITRRQLQADPGYQRELLEWYDDVVRERRIDPEQVRRRIAELEPDLDGSDGSDG